MKENLLFKKRYKLYLIIYHSEPNSHSRNKIKVAIDLSSYVTKSSVEKATVVDASEFAKKKLI